MLISVKYAFRRMHSCTVISTEVVNRPLKLPQLEAMVESATEGPSFVSNYTEMISSELNIYG
jgi:hypothetical protein